MENISKFLDKKKIRKFILGYNLVDGFLFRFTLYLLLISIGFIYIYPMLYMLSMSFQSYNDIINPTVSWIPSSWYPDNFAKAFSVLKYWKTLGQSLVVTLLPAIIQTIVTAIIGYGFAKFEFPGKKVLFFLVLLTFIIPSQVYTIPKYVMFNNLNLLGSPLAIILPSLFGQGLNSAIFILIYYQFFRMAPKSFDEAAEIDGASELTIFLKINVPLAAPAFLTTFLFSFVWYWNETYISSLFLDGNFKSLQIRLANFVSEFSQLEGIAELNEGVRLAATLLIILPMLIVYLCLQKYFIEGVEKSGITGE